MSATAVGDNVARLSRFQAPMHHLVVRGRSVDIRAYEIASAEQIAAELQPPTLELLQDTKQLLGSILDDCQRVEPGEHGADDASSAPWTNSCLPFERAIDATMAMLGSRQIVEEIAFMAQLELRQRQERLVRVRASQGGVALLGECDSSLRRIRKALNAVDAAIAKVESVSPLLDFTSELQTSLAVRRAYAKFRARVMAGGEPTAETLRARFRGAGTQIAKLVGWEIYPEMRVADRLLLRELQQRILDWLRGAADGGSASGIRLWQDLAGCVEMFSLVNRRQDLVEHDSAIIRRLLDVIEHSALPEPTWDEVRALEGLDHELDQVIAASAKDPAALRAIVSRLAIQLGVRQAPSSEVPW